MTTGATMTEYTAPEGATHQCVDTPHLFYRPGANGFIEARWAANRLPNDVWTSGHGRNELLSVASVYRPITPTWRDGAPPEVESKPAEGPRFTPKFNLPAGAVFLGKLDSPAFERDLYFVPLARCCAVWGDGSGGATYHLTDAPFEWALEARRLAIKRGLWSPPEAKSGVEGTGLSQQEFATYSQQRKDFKPEDYRTPRDIEGEPAALARIEAMPHSMPFFSDAALAEMELRHRKAEAARSLLTIAPRDHRLGHWGANTGD